MATAPWDVPGLSARAYCVLGWFMRFCFVSFVETGWPQTLEAAEDGPEHLLFASPSQALGLPRSTTMTKRLFCF